MTDTLVPPTMPKLSVIDSYRMVRSRVEHEDNLITQRLNWFLASQSFLFTAYAINLNAPDSLRHDLRHTMVLSMVPMMAIAVALLVFMGVLGGLVAMSHLHDWLRQYVAAADLSELPSLQWFRGTRFLGMAAPLGLPPLFVVVWIYLMVVGSY